MLHDDMIIVANAIGGDGIIAFPMPSRCKTMVSVPALASRDNALRLTGFEYQSSLLQRRNIRIVGVKEAPSDSRYFAADRRDTASWRAISCKKWNY
jgi:hypothetical protein